MQEYVVREIPVLSINSLGKNLDNIIVRKTGTTGTRKSFCIYLKTAQIGCKWHSLQAEYIRINLKYMEYELQVDASHPGPCISCEFVAVPSQPLACEV